MATETTNYAEFAKDLAIAFAPAALKGFQGAFSAAKTKLQSLQRDAFTQYIETALLHVCQAKTFFHSDHPEPLNNFYVPASIEANEGILNEVGISAIIRRGRRSTVSGTAGSGKSILMRHLFLDCVRRKKQTPIFLELRHFNQSNELFKSFLTSHLMQKHLDLTAPQATAALRAGVFAFLLDGLDEIDPSRREASDQELRAFADEWDKNVFVISSRPDPALRSWSGFNNFSIVPLELDDAVKLIQNLPYNERAKERFIRDLTSGLYDKRRDFCSNPLLLSVMLLSHAVNAEIPHKQSVFYAQAYDALFHRHDAAKEGYRRKRRSPLDVSDYQRLFAAFSMVTYDRRLFSFTRAEALEVTGRALPLARVNLPNNEEFLDDSLRATCLLSEDGPSIVFTHRSFQEYFVADFIKRQDLDTQISLIQKYADNVRSDDVVALLFEMSPVAVEKALFLPEIRRIKEVVKLKRTVGVTSLGRYLKDMYAEFRHDPRERSINCVVRHNRQTESSIQDAIIDAYFPRYIDELSADQRPDGVYDAMVASVFGEEWIRSSQSFPLSSPFFKWCATHGRYFSLATLQLLLNLERTILESHASQAKSLSEILDGVSQKSEGNTDD